MRDIPVFETDFGTAGLVLNQVPCNGCAYIHILQTKELDGLLDECVSFCKAVGAGCVFASGDYGLTSYPHYTDVLRMRCFLEEIEDTDACLIPVTIENSESWRVLYNERMSGVDNAAILTEISCRKLVKTGGAYFVHRKGILLGIGIAAGEEISAIASVVHGQGATVMKALCHALSGPTVNVEVATTNHRAIQLYGKLGFTPCRIVRSWYRVL